MIRIVIKINDRQFSCDFIDQAQADRWMDEILGELIRKHVIYTDSVSQHMMTYIQVEAFKYDMR